MSEGDVQVILHMLDTLDEKLCEIHEEVKRTNGRVTELEMSEAEWRGKQAAKHMQNMIITTVLSGCILAGVVWFVSNSIN